MDNAYFEFAERPQAYAYAGAPLDRASELRENAQAMRAMRESPETRFVLIGRDMPIVRRGVSEPPLFALPELEALGGAAIEAFLGRQADGGAVFGARLDDSRIEQRADASDGFLDRRALIIAGRADLDLIDLRSLTLQGVVAPDYVTIFAQAKAILDWHARHRFCAQCGAPTRPGAAGWRRECDACKAQHFPRTDPVVIMLAVDADHCLLGRQRRFPKGLYSALAGFVEPGETFEEAVRREILEESGVVCDRVRYVASQPWPFPSSLMVGCLARATTHALSLDDQELEDARWFDRDEMRALFEKRHPAGLIAPHRMAIAHHLIRFWLDGAV